MPFFSEGLRCVAITPTLPSPIKGEGFRRNAGMAMARKGVGPMKSCAIDGALVLSDNGFAAGTVLVEGRLIAAVAWSAAEREALRARAETVVAADGRWLIPGLVDGHAHAYAALLRGTQNAVPLELWAFYTVLYGRAFDAAAMRAAILLGAAERIRAGITGWIDHWPMMHLGEAALAAHEASGLRVGYAPFLHDVADDALLGLAVPAPVARLAGGAPPLDPPHYAAQFAAMVETARAGSGRVSVLLGPNAPQRCSPSAWELWRSLRERHGVYVHTHLMETRAQAAIGARAGRAGWSRRWRARGCSANGCRSPMASGSPRPSATCWRRIASPSFTTWPAT
jgi:5-methylthioadenosine/S-adenosylhomocysteine deaminase